MPSISIWFAYRSKRTSDWLSSGSASISLRTIRRCLGSARPWAGTQASKPPPSAVIGSSRIFSCLEVGAVSLVHVGRFRPTLVADEMPGSCRLSPRPVARNSSLGHLPAATPMKSVSVSSPDDYNAFQEHFAIIKLKCRNVAVRVDLVKILPLFGCMVFEIDPDEIDVETELVCDDMGESETGARLVGGCVQGAGSRITAAPPADDRRSASTSRAVTCVRCA